MPRIAHVISTPSGAGGAERVMGALVGAGSPRGGDQIVLNPFTENPANNDVKTLVGATNYRGCTGRGIRDLPRVRSWIYDQLAEFRPEIVHVHLFHASVAVASIRRVSGEARLLTHHHGDLLRVRGQRIRVVLDRRAGRRYDKVVAVSPLVERFLIEGYGYPADKIRTIVNGWSGDPLPLEPPSYPHVVCVANLRPEKDHDTVLRAFQKVVRTLPDARLTLVGDGVRSSQIESLIDRLGLSGNVDTIGAATDVWRILATANVFVLSSTYETFGLAVMEAMAAGLPVVASSVGALPDLVRAGVTGLLVPPRDPAALAEGLLAVLKDPERGLAMGREGRAVVETLTVDKMLDQYEELYAELVTEGNLAEPG